jgi:hypothetical protein
VNREGVPGKKTIIGGTKFLITPYATLTQNVSQACIALHQGINNTISLYTRITRTNASYALLNTPLYSQNRDSWHNVRTVRQTEQECGMRLCLAASMIAQYKGTIPKRVKSCTEIENIAIFAREYVVNILTAKQWTGIDNEN